MTKLKNIEQELLHFLQSPHEPGEATQIIRKTLQVLHTHIEEQKTSADCGCACIKEDNRTVYDYEIATMNLDKLAHKYTELVKVNDSYLFWLTSNGQLFTFDKYDVALEHQKGLLRQKYDK